MMTKKETRGVNEKFVNLLHRTFDKYKDINVLERRGEENVYPKETDEAIETSPLKQALKPPLKPSIATHSRGSSKKKLGRKSKKEKIPRSKVLLRLFTPDEDKLIVKTIKNSAEKKSGVAEVAKVLKRSQKSINARIALLENKSGFRRSRAFSLQEDFLIIDKALKSLKQCKSLEVTQLHDYEDLAKSLDRGRKSGFERWNFQLKMWLLQYYQKTLNLEIRPMLIHLLADNFDSIETIDWDWVRKVPEFSGYTSAALRRFFYNRIIQRMAIHLEVERTEITLMKLKEAAKDFNFCKVKNSVMDRQRKVIDYFIKHVEMESIQFREKEGIK